MSGLLHARLVVPLPRNALAGGPLRGQAQKGGGPRSFPILWLAPFAPEALEAVDLALERVVGGQVPFELAFDAPHVAQREVPLVRADVLDPEGRLAALRAALLEALTAYGFEPVEPPEGPGFTLARPSAEELEALRPALGGVRLGTLPVGRVDVQVAPESDDGRRVWANRQQHALTGLPAGRATEPGDRAALLAELERRVARRAARITATPGAVSAPPAPGHLPGDEA